MAYKGKYKGAAIDDALDKAITALQLKDIEGLQPIIADLETIRSNAAKGATALQSIPDEYVTESELAEELKEKQDTISDLATIRSNASKGATALQSVPSEYVTETELTNKGYATTASVNTALGDKVDKVNGKQLSTEDFTTALKNKLAGLSNYDDTTLTNAINGLRNDFNALVSGDTTTAIKTFNEIIAFLDGVSDTQTLEGIIASIEQQIASVQSAIPTKVSQLTNDKGYLTSHQDISGLLDRTEAASTYLSKTEAASTYLGKTAKAADATKADSATKATQDASGNIITTTYATKTELTNGLADKVSTVSGKGLSTNDYTTTEKNKLASIAAGAEVNVQSDWNTTDTSADSYIKNKPSLATVATSGSYNDLSNKPTIPPVVTVDSALSSTSTNPVQNKVINSALAGKQATISDLDTIRSGASAGATAVQPSSLAKVATSGSYNDLSNKPTIPSAVTESTVSGWGFTKNTGTYSKPSTGIPKTDLANDVQSSLSKADTALQSYTEQYTGTYSKPSGGIPKTDLASAVQTSLGKADTALQYPAYPVVNQGTSNTTTTINPNTLYKWGTVTSLSITLGTEVSGIQNEYVFEFVSGSTATTLSLPSTIKWANGNAPEIEANTTYQISIVNNLGVIGSFK